MVNGLGVLGWGVGGIEAEAAMLGQPVSMLIPEVVGMRLTGRPAPGAIYPASCCASQVCASTVWWANSSGILRRRTPAPAARDRATIDMAPEVRRDLRHLPYDEGSPGVPAPHRPPRSKWNSSKPTPRNRACSSTTRPPEARYSAVLELDIGGVVPALAGPSRPQGPRRPEQGACRASGRRPASWRRPNPTWYDHDPRRRDLPAWQRFGGYRGDHIVRNTSNPSVMVAAGLLAKKAVEKGLVRQPGSKTSLGPGSRSSRAT
ncbi:MAG: aconitase family protein [Planctomycetota bacterium]